MNFVQSLEFVSSEVAALISCEHSLYFELHGDFVTLTTVIFNADFPF
jgi:hypothetical protein